MALIMYIKMWICDGFYGDAKYDEVCEAYVVMLFRGGSLVSPSKYVEFAAEKILSAIPSPIKKITDKLSKKK